MVWSISYGAALMEGRSVPVAGAIDMGKEEKSTPSDTVVSEEKTAALWATIETAADKICAALFSKDIVTDTEAYTDLAEIRAFEEDDLKLTKYLDTLKEPDGSAHIPQPELSSKLGKAIGRILFKETPEDSLGVSLSAIRRELKQRHAEVALTK
ncbi:MAG: hypothetical protein HGA90_03010 [Alphaproteobacteria bacterium]|nr:hypothetical protein [Alphaproteobacteria bacterium]